LEFDHSIVVIGLKKLHEDLPSLSHEMPLLLFHPGAVAFACIVCILLRIAAIAARHFSRVRLKRTR
jgi:hypothetical protein